MTTPELRPEGVNGTAHGAVAIIGVEADRIRSLAQDVPKKTAKVNRTAGRIGTAAAAIIEETKALEAAMAAAAAAPAKTGDWIFEAVDVRDILEVVSESLAAGNADRAILMLKVAESHEAASEKPTALKVARLVIPMMFDLLSEGYRPVADMPIGDAASELAALLGDALGEK